VHLNNDSGFAITYPNGWTVSVGLAPHHFATSEKTRNGFSAKLVEVAVFKKAAAVFVRGHVNPIKLTRLMGFVSEMGDRSSLTKQTRLALTALLN